MPRGRKKIRSLPEGRAPLRAEDLLRMSGAAAQAWDGATAPGALDEADARVGGAGPRAGRGAGGAAPRPTPGGGGRAGGSALGKLVRRAPQNVRRLVAGAVSGGVGKTCTSPLEVVRMRVMVGGGEVGLAQVVREIWSKGRVRGFFAGNLADVVRVAPQKAVQLAAFENFKRLLGRADPETGEVATGAAGAFCAGALAGVVSTAVCYPLETVRTRMGVDPGAYRGILDCVRQLALSSGGVRTLYGGIGASMTGVIPYAALNLGTYDTLQRGYRLYTGEDKVPKEVCGLCGAVAGPLAATATFPLEVVRRRMMMGAGYSSVLEALRVIWATEGGQALFRGCGLSWLKLAPSAGITFMVYELVKEELQVSR